MSIALDVRCDDCRKRLDVGDEVFCAECRKELQGIISAQEKEIDRLKDEIDALGAEP